MAEILVIGANGQLGQCLRTVVGRRKITSVYFPEEGTANILDIPALEGLFKNVQPQYVINCAAYTAVDKAEDEVELAFDVNVTGAYNLAKLCNKYQSTLIHISTDFVFEGNSIQLLKEDDITKPISVYGETKLKGEIAIQQNLKEHIIIRTSWLYSEFANNFVKTMIKLGSEREQLNIIADQIGTPTYAIDLANGILDIINCRVKHYGIYHFSNEGVTSWFDFAKAIFFYANIKTNVAPIPTTAYPTKAKRPHFSVMDKTKIKSHYNLSIPYWLDSLKVCITQLNP